MHYATMRADGAAVRVLVGGVPPADGTDRVRPGAPIRLRDGHRIRAGTITAVTEDGAQAFEAELTAELEPEPAAPKGARCAVCRGRATVHAADGLGGRITVCRYHVLQDDPDPADPTVHAAVLGPESTAEEAVAGPVFRIEADTAGRTARVYGHEAAETVFTRRSEAEHVLAGLRCLDPDAADGYWVPEVTRKTIRVEAGPLPGWARFVDHGHGDVRRIVRGEAEETEGTAAAAG